MNNLQPLILDQASNSERSMTWVKDAIAQKKLIRYFLLNFVSFFLLAFDIPYISVLLVLSVFLYQAKLISDAKSLLGDASGTAYIYGLFSLMPGIGVILMISLHAGCSAVLKIQGIKFGLFGVSSELLKIAEHAAKKRA